LSDDGLTVMQRLIVCIAEAYEATDYTEVAANNADAWITDLWRCYHPYDNYGAYCMVTASTIVNSAITLAAQAGAPCPAKAIPSAPIPPKSRNRERTLYGNVYDTLQELTLSNPTLISQKPTVGSVFMRPGDTGRNNHAGIVVSAPLRDDVYIETIEGNTSTSGNGLSKKGFQRVRYSKDGYERFANTDWILSARAATAYNNARPQGWYFFAVAALCEAPKGLYSATLCLNVQVDCDLRDRVEEPPPPPATGKECPPAPANTQGFTQWRLVSEVQAEIARTETVDASGVRRVVVAGTQSRPSRGGSGTTTTGATLPVTDKYPAQGREITPDGCWVRWPLSVVPPAPPQNKACPEGLIVRSCCEGGATTLSVPSAKQMLGLGDLKDKGGREALLSSQIATSDLAARGYNRRYVEAGQMFPMIRLANGQAVTVVTRGSVEFQLATAYNLFGPAPAFIELDRTKIEGGVGSGWAERLAAGFQPDTYLTVSSGGVIQDDIGLFRNAPADTVLRSRRNLVGGKIEGLSLFEMLAFLERNPDAYKGRQPVIVIGGEPTTAISILDSASGILGSAVNLIVPGAGTLLTGAIQIANRAYKTGSLQLRDAFTFVGSLAQGMAQLAADSGGKVFGVEAKVYRDMSRYSQSAFAIDGIFKARGNAAQTTAAILGELRTNVPELSALAEREFADEAKWLRGAFAEVRQYVGTALDDARTALTTFVDGQATSVIGNLKVLDSGIDYLFAGLLSESSTGLSKSAAKIPTVQDLLTSNAHPSLVNTRAGSQDLFGRILALPATFAADVTDGAIHQAIAGIVTGKRIADGALDQLTMDSLLYRAEDFAKRKWKYDIPLTVPEDRRECYEREIAVCIGTECCPPLVMVNGVCSTKTDRPPQPSTECVREVNGQLVYCKPANCSGGAGEYEQSTILLKSNTGTPYEITASRRVGTQLWGNMLILAWEPAPGTNDYRRPATPPIQAAVAGVSIPSEDFEVLRSSQGAPTVAAEAPQGASTQNECDGIYPARIVADGSNRIVANIDGVWMEIVDCCPQKGVTPPQPKQGEQCCDEVAAISRKIDRLIGAMGTGGVTPVSRDRDTTVIGRDTGVAPVRSACDLSEVTRLLRQLPGEIARLSGGTTTATADVTEIAASLKRLERAVGEIKPSSPCDNSQVLTALLKMQASLEKAALGYDEANAMRYADIIARLDAFVKSDVTVCDTSTLRTELAKQTASIAELRAIIEKGASVDVSAIERELIRQRELLLAITERLDSGKVVTTTTPTDKGAVTTIVKCDDAELKAALSEMREMVRLVPVVRQELQSFKTAVDRQYAELRSQLAIATELLRKLESKGSNDGAVLQEIRDQKNAILALIEKYSGVAGTCDVSELRTILVALQAATTDNAGMLRTILERLNTIGKGTTTVCDTTAVREAVREVVQSNMARHEAVLQRLVERIEAGDVVKTVTVNVDSLERKLDAVLERLRNMQSYDNAELLRRIEELTQRPGSNDVKILRKLDLLLGQTTDERERTTLRRVRETVQNRAGDCPDCPAYVEEHRKVFYRYPNMNERNVTNNTFQTQQQSQQLHILQPEQRRDEVVEIVPLEMPCDGC
jgi:hypothetical protein